MKSKMNLKSILFIAIIAIIGIISLFFINMSLAANTAKVTVETANLRDTADTNSKILVQISEGEEVEILEPAGEWYKVKYKKITGYLRGDLLNIENEVEVDNTTGQENESEEPNQEKPTEPAQISEGKNYIRENTKLKIVPVINATDIIEAKQGEEVEVIEIINGWACVQNATSKGWIRTEKLQSEEERKQAEEAKRQEEEKKKQEEAAKKEAAKKAAEKNTKKVTKYVNSTSVNLRKEASKSSEILTSIPLNTAVTVTSENGGWAKVKVNGKEGYIASSLLSDKKQETSRSSTTRTENKQTTQNTSNESTTAPVSGNGSAVVEYAKQFIGVKYVYGGSTPSTGFDCSGFTAYVYKKFGVNLPHNSSAQQKLGTAVSKANLAPGDLVFYSGHVAIYVGGGQVIHAPRPGKSVCIVPLNQASTSGFLGARRILQ